MNQADTPLKMKNVGSEEMTKNLSSIPLEELKKENLIEVYKIEAAFSNILRTSAIEMAELTKMVDENNKISNLGKKASEILQNSLNKFEESVADLVDTKNYLKKKQELDAIVDTSLNSIFLKQLSILRELSISHFKAATVNEDVPADFAFFTADSFFVREAEDSIRPGSFWSYTNERTNVHNAIREISSRRKQ